MILDQDSFLTQKLIDDVAKFVKAFYFGCKINVPKTTTATELLKSGKIAVRESMFTGQPQISAVDICKHLDQKFMSGNKKSLVASGLVDFDLYQEGLNFVFGLAIAARRCGCTSIHRSHPSFTGQQFASEVEAYNRVLFGVCKTMVHEIGHMFGMKHCTYYECGMNGSNSAEESKDRPIQFCAVCYRKLASCINFDPLQRYQALIDVC